MSIRYVRLCSCLPALLLALGSSLQAADPTMAYEKENALIDQHCAVCHTDAARNGGLSLEGFAVEQAAPSLNAMLLSKITGGVLLGTVQSVASNPAAETLVDEKAQNGALAAAGLPVPDKATTGALIRTLAARTQGADDWSVERSAGTVTASILREVPSAGAANGAEAYRLIASCNAASRDGYLQLTWSPVPQSGMFEVSADGRPPRRFRVEGSEKMGNGSNAVLHGLASLTLPDMVLPSRSLTIRDTLPGEPVAFPLETLPKDAREELAACFPGE